MPKLSTANAQRIASLFNSVQVAEMMMATHKGHPQVYADWKRRAEEAARALNKEFGIELVAYKHLSRTV